MVNMCNSGRTSCGERHVNGWGCWTSWLQEL